MEKALLRGIKAGIWVLMMIILLGTLMIWIIKPTKTFMLHWQTHLRNVTTSACFGSQGSVLLIYTFPILFFAILGCVFIHMGEKLKDEKKFKRCRRQQFDRLRRPVVFKGPLGIISWTELTFLIMFIALLIWHMASYLHVTFTNFMNQQYMAERKESIWEAKLEWVSFWLGCVGNVGLVVLFFPVTRRSSVLAFFGLTSEGSIKYHIWIGHITMVLFTAHGVGYIILWCYTNRISEMLKWSKTGVSNLAGEVSLLAGLVLWATTIPRIRQKCFELFFYTHYLYIPFLVFFVYHLGIAYASMMLPGFYLFLIDRFLRYLQSRRLARLVSARVLPCQTVELNFSKTPDLKYTPASIAFVNVPCISRLQWHPFTIISSCGSDEEQISVLVKSQGSWTQKLCEHVSSPHPPSSLPNHLQISIEGLYGPVSSHFLRHDMLVMVCGGSGIAPFISIIRRLIYSPATTPFDSKTTPSPPQLPAKLLLICAFKDSTGLTMLELIRPVSCASPMRASQLLQIEAYVTRDKEPIAQAPMAVQTVWFKPNGSSRDRPMSPILGPSSWLWLATIIASSFIIYLVSVALLTRYYIYPIDHQTLRIYPLAATASLHMALICVSVAVAATTAALWNQKRTVESAEVGVGLPSCRDWGKELESVPRHSLAQNTKVHYGERPDLRRMLMQCKDTSVGVLVCGPGKMRHEVAEICSSSSAANLHFESISFSW